MTERKPLSTTELARLIGCSAKFIRTEIQAGHLSAIRVGRGHAAGTRLLIPYEEARRYCLALGAPIPRNEDLPVAVKALWLSMLASPAAATLGRDGIVLDVTPDQEELVGFSRSELQGQHVSALLVNVAEYPTIAAPTTHAIEVLIRTKAGPRRMLTTLIRFVIDDVTYGIGLLSPLP